MTLSEYGFAYVTVSVDDEVAYDRAWNMANRWANLTDQYIANEYTADGLVRIAVIPASACPVPRDGWQSPLV